jgi:hypothetical protein
MGKISRTLFFSALFVGAVVVLIVASGSGPQAWATVQALFVRMAEFFKIAPPG